MTGYALRTIMLDLNLKSHLRKKPQQIRTEHYKNVSKAYRTNP
jgi:hypothetical protein